MDQTWRDLRAVLPHLVCRGNMPAMVVCSSKSTCPASARCGIRRRDWERVCQGDLVAEINADSASFTDVETAYNASSAGDTINVPAGSATWNSTLTVQKQVQIVGAGVGSTVLTLGTPSRFFVYDCLPAMAGTDVDLFRLSGFTFDLNGKTGGVGGHGIFLDNNDELPVCSQVRIDNNRFTNSTQVGAAIFNFSCAGVIDNNTFDTMRGPMRPGWGTNTGSGDWNWNNLGALSWGTSNDSMYIEDNTFDDVTFYIKDCDQGGGREVFRYNTFDGASTNFPWMDIHGGRGTIRGCVGGEVYGNRFTGGGFLVTHRGGRLAFHHNLQDTAQSIGTVRIQQPNSDGCPEEFQEIVNRTYVWRNRHGVTGTLISTSNNEEGCPSWPSYVENSTFWEDDTGFDGTAGVGAGTLASRPSTCTTGVGYWATDQSTTDLTGMTGPAPATPIDGTLYRCSATDTWESYYTPLEYPHPLRVDPLRGESPTGSLLGLFLG